MDEDFSLVQPFDLITKDVFELRRMIKEKKKNVHKAQEKELSRERDPPRKQVNEREKQVMRKERSKDLEGAEAKLVQNPQGNQSDREMGVDKDDKKNSTNEESHISNGKGYMLI